MEDGSGRRSVWERYEAARLMENKGRYGMTSRLLGNGSDVEEKGDDGRHHGNECRPRVFTSATRDQIGRTEGRDG